MAAALLITGTVGAGKTSVADAAGDALPEVRRRLTGRHAYDPQALGWHIDRAAESAGILETAQVEDYTVDATHGTPPQVAAQVVEGWRI
ncbi:hypothetical protein [Nonomuraea zeae]|uniref:Uncharacterized protein n=1 Tax=Nonomuraea zeae TaxID=1642303 RepID=A0A5S4FSY1_9ACTN|nr:hypothetical protein [Nonomuraea zeae]TMR23474.1 hypothetical protein ETD85_47930 [Nonomuraea zeae]